MTRQRAEQTTGPPAPLLLSPSGPLLCNDKAALALPEACWCNERLTGVEVAGVRKTKNSRGQEDGWRGIRLGRTFLRERRQHNTHVQGPGSETPASQSQAARATRGGAKEETGGIRAG